MLPKYINSIIIITLYMIIQKYWQWITLKMKMFSRIFLIEVSKFKNTKSSVYNHMYSDLNNDKKRDNQDIVSTVDQSKFAKSRNTMRSTYTTVKSMVPKSLILDANRRQMNYSKLMNGNFINQSLGNINSSLLKPSKMNKSRLTDFHSRCDHYQTLKKTKLEKERSYKEKAAEIEYEMFSSRPTVHSRLEHRLNNQSLSASKSNIYCSYFSYSQCFIKVVQSCQSSKRKT